eukprot:10473-Heterococcus_DN1.PRE.1
MNKLLLQDATAGDLCSALLRRAVRVHACPRDVHYSGECAHTLALLQFCSLLCTIRSTLLPVRLGISGCIQLVSQRVRDRYRSSARHTIMVCVVHFPHRWYAVVLRDSNSCTCTVAVLPSLAAAAQSRPSLAAARTAARAF